MSDRIETLIEKLKTSDRDAVKSSIIEELASIGDHRALRPIIEALGDNETLVRWKAIKALGHFGKDASNLLLKMLNTEDVYMRRNIVQALGEIGGDAEERAAEYIKASMKTPVVSFISGRSAPEGKRMGHAGAIISGGQGTAEAKVAAFEAAGVPVADTPSAIPALVSAKLRG